MIAISTVGCNNEAADYALHLYRKGLFKNFEYMADENIILKDLMSVITICMQPELAKSCSGHSMCANSQHDRESYLNYLVTNIKKAVHYKCSNIIVWPGYVPSLNGFEKHNRVLHHNETYDIAENQRTSHIQNLCRSLFYLCKNFPDINFCIPTGRTFYEIPIFIHEVKWIIEDVKCPNLKYWHNTAHSYLLEKMKLEQQDNWLESLGNYTSGVHLEDVAGFDTLCPPGTGEIKFQYVKSHLPKNAIRILRIAEQFGEFGIETALDILR
ncbi:hypothetical protein [Candidatus Uabimicrobium sp. HlEnr_7]|uniref:hypothetical protein n=1 Tax=Candidatus Uabimicrobium helgolandensis TaxID=3095367 RepID=UPI0035589568